MTNAKGKPYKRPDSQSDDALAAFKPMPAVKFKKSNYFWLIAIHIFILIMCLPIFVLLIKGVI